MAGYLVACRRNLLRRPHAMPQRLLQQRHAAEVCVGEVDVADWRGGGAERRVAHEAVMGRIMAWPQRMMSMGWVSARISGWRAREVRERDLGPFVVAGGEEAFAGDVRRGLAQRAVERDYGRPVVEPHWWVKTT